MVSQNLVLGYVQACSSGALPSSECSPVWQLGIIAAFLVCAVLTLVVLRFQSRVKSAAAS